MVKKSFFEGLPLFHVPLPVPGAGSERLRYYHEGRLHLGLGYWTLRGVMEEALRQSAQNITREAE